MLDVHLFIVCIPDDKPVVVITHGDLLSLSDRVKVRIYVGELLGVSPTRQIFDIPGMKFSHAKTSGHQVDIAMGILTKV